VSAASAEGLASEGLVLRAQKKCHAARISPYDREAARESGSEISHRVRLHLEGCDITSQSIACVGIRCGADPGCSATASTMERC
jgi:hypothetical protein